MDDDRYGYAREKLWQAIETLVGHGAVQDRLTSAAEFLLRLQPDKQLPREHRDEFEQIKAALTTIPLSSASGPTPRPITDEEGTKLAHRVLSLYTDLIGGI
jgi:hypothetical protein